MKPAKKAGYHHGNLREALVDTALEHLKTQTREELSLRGLAKALGVTPTAVYSHFEDKIALLIEIRIRGFEQLFDCLSRHLDPVSTSDPETKLRAIAHGYMNFAVDNPNLFDTLFSWTPDFARIPRECIEAGADSECLLRDAMIELLTENGTPPTEDQGSLASFFGWSLVHGISTLLKSGAIDGAVYCEHWPETFGSAHPNTQAKIIEHLFTIELEGIKAAIPKIKSL